MSSTPMSPHSNAIRVNILGAGVSGLSTALFLLERGGYSVKVVATHLPSDLHINYTSPWAGAHWRSFADNADLEQQKLEEITYKHFEHLADTDSEAGIMYLQGHDYWDVKPKDFEDPWFNRILKNYRHLSKEELPPGVEFGTTYTTVAMNAPKYLKYLQQRIIALGGTIERATVPSLKALAQIPHYTGAGNGRDNKADVIVNCSGLGSRNLLGVQDHQMFPTRGQIVVVKVPDELWPAAKQFTMERYAEGSSFGKGTITYIIPRDNGEIVLGGTTEHWNYQEEPSEETTKAIMSRVLASKPDLFSRATVIRSCVGLRPNRHGGVRVSALVEQQDWNEGWDPSVLVVAHNYGHAGFGYQASAGCAQKTVSLIERCVVDLESYRNQARTMAKL